MHALEAAFKVFLEVTIGLSRRTPARHHHIVMAWLGKFRGQLTDGVFQPPPDPIAGHGVADPFCDGEAEAWAQSVGLLWQIRRSCNLRFGLEQKCDILAAAAAANTQKVLSLFEGDELHGSRPLAGGLSNRPHRAGLRLGRQAFAAFGPATSKDTDTADSLHTLAKPMAALAYQLAWLIGPFHDKTPNVRFKTLSWARMRAIRMVFRITACFSLALHSDVIIVRSNKMRPENAARI